MTSPEKPQSDTTRSVVRAFMDTLLGYTVDGQYRDRDLNAWFTEDIELVLPGTLPATPWAGTYKGHAELERFWGICREHLDIISHDVQHIIVEDDKAVVISFERYASHVTKRKGVQTYAWLFICRGDRICYWRLFEDTEAISKVFDTRIPAEG